MTCRGSEHADDHEHAVLRRIRSPRSDRDAMHMRMIGRESVLAPK